MSKKTGVFEQFVLIVVACIMDQVMTYYRNGTLGIDLPTPLAWIVSIFLSVLFYVAVGFVLCIIIGAMYSFLKASFQDYIDRCWKNDVNGPTVMERFDKIYFPFMKNSFTTFVIGVILIVNSK